MFRSRDDSPSILDRCLVRNSTDIPLHERFYKLSQIHSELSRSSYRNRPNVIAPDEVRIQIRPFSANPMETARRHQSSIPASNFRADNTMTSSSRPTASRLQNRSSGGRSTMRMDLKPKSLSERMRDLSPLREAMKAKYSPKKRPEAISESARVKKKVTQRLSVQARLGQNTQKLSAKERLAKAAGVTGFKKPIQNRAQSNLNRTSFKPKMENRLKGSFKNNISKNKNKKYSLNNKQKAAVKNGALASKTARKPKPSANDLDKELEDFMATKN